ncbi:hypothetical protein ARMSODRAFT_950881 [Armillaria solidipes]|uniref:Uncharacterized protein n=1 Tax=Armillaria solidipes TaxID=1076256 RepID=A0A2H3CHQ1_9AGAR|nr:hypothetical protein ARMSODRAFT_950881 [Armillaria solidipes]
MALSQAPEDRFISSKVHIASPNVGPMVSLHCLCTMLESSGTWFHLCRPRLSLWRTPYVFLAQR